MGKSMNGASTEGETMDGASMDEKSMDVESTRGEPTAGAHMNERQMDGNSLDGVSMNGDFIDGGTWGGAPTNGESMNDEESLGEGRRGPNFAEGGIMEHDVRIFTSNVEPAALELIESIAADPRYAGLPIRIMPDVHAGKGIVVGFTCPLPSQVNPSHIGGDIGCGIETELFGQVLPADRFELFEQRVRNAIPMGKKLQNNRVFDVRDFCKSVRRELDRAIAASGGLVEDVPFRTEEDISRWCQDLHMDDKAFYKSIGTLGGGNHFIELDFNEEKGLMGATVHTGSRNLGQKVFSRWNQKAVSAGGFLAGRLAQGYLTDMVIAQAYAKYNRRVILEKIAEIYGRLCKGKVTQVISSVHNYIDFQDMVIRKGAIRAYAGEQMVIPFNMRDGIAICTGKSNGDWNNSAPHGAGRAMSRNQARERLSLDEYRRQMAGVYSTCVGESTLDESPMAYKDAGEIVAAIQPTCDIDYFMKPVVNMKDVEGWR